MNKGLIKLGLLLTVSVILLIALGVVNAGATQNNNDNVTICHKNNGNGWTKIMVDDDAVNGVGNGDHNTSQHQGGQDIIPPGYWDFNGRNWNQAGQAIWNNNCNEVSPTATPTPTVTLTVTPTVTPTPTKEPECEEECEPTPTPTPELPRITCEEADVDNDKDVDIFDYNKIVTDANLQGDLETDLNNDQVVNQTDLDVFAQFTNPYELPVKCEEPSQPSSSTNTAGSSASFSSPVCTGDAPAKPIATGGTRVDEDTVEVRWWRSTDPVDHYILVYGYSQDNLPYGVPNVDPSLDHYLLHGVENRHVWYQVIAEGSNYCQSKSGIVDP